MFIIGLLFFSVNLFAANDDWDDVNFSSQAEFDDFAKDLGGTLNFNALGPAAPLGILGFDVAAGMSVTSFSTGYLDKVGAEHSDTLVFAKVQVQKGLPLGIDIGLSRSSAINSNVVKTGGFISYAILKGGIATPAINTRFSMSKLSNVDVLEFSSQTLEVSISKGITIVTPFVGAGAVRSKTRATVANRGGVDLKESSSTQGKYFAGINMNLLFMDILVQYTKVGESSTSALKLGFRF